ncbi:DUF262 domain-containing protein [Clostridium butyricum]|uniref:DUF262 domain-containing protein n=1 Tax=Clostridium butyricum TaxID=1492 RepID=UPI001F58CFD5|nr:DUF262 domain-containing protein [Clostridium butyricum]
MSNEIEFETIEEEIDEEEIDKKITKNKNDEELARKYTDGQLRIVRTTMDFPLNNFSQILEDKSYMQLNPSYQRRNRWDKKKKSLLIESLLMNIPIPPVFLFEKDYNSYEVMDGLQRLTTIEEFLNDKFSLRSLEYWSELNGKKYSDLPDVLKRGLKRRTVSAIILLAESSREISDTDIRMVLFKRLNTGGIQLNAQELRNALYPGLFNEMLLELSRNDTFTDIWGIPKYQENEKDEPSNELISNTLYKNMYDCEIVLRFFAVRDAILKNKKGSMKTLLDSCATSHSTDSKETITILSNLYINTLRDLKSIFGDDIFRLPKINKLSIPLYDSLTVAYSIIEDKTKLLPINDIKNNLKNKLNSEHGYAILTGKLGTSKSIIDRVNMAQVILLGE